MEWRHSIVFAGGGQLRRSVAELTLQVGASAALAARAHGANKSGIQVVSGSERGALAEPSVASTGLLLVVHAYGS
jgi:hypothetical protein